MEEKQGSNIGHRWIELRLYKYEEYLTFGQE
jgi:hypothetical protein